MKKIKHFTNAFILVMIALCINNGLYAQNKNESNRTNTIETSIKNKDFLFVAETVQPLRGRIIQLNSWYDLKVSGDTLASHLPYFGRAFSAPMNPSESGYIFTSEGLQYEVSERKKDGWDVTIVPTERSYGEKFTLSVFENGSATLMVTSNNRQPINFRGYIKEKKS